jgi:hypothetical protein
MSSESKHPMITHVSSDDVDKKFQKPEYIFTNKPLNPLDKSKLPGVWLYAVVPPGYVEHFCLPTTIMPIKTYYFLQDKVEVSDFRPEAWRLVQTTCAGGYMHVLDAKALFVKPEDWKLNDLRSVDK